MIHDMTAQFQKEVHHFCSRHPVLSTLLFLIGLPAGLLLTVTLAVSCIMLPIGFLFGCL